MATFPSKVNYATGDILTATNMNDVGNAINTLNGAQVSAGKNFVLNSAMNVWQRGTSIALAAATSPSSSTYVADRWQTSTGASQAITVSRQAVNDSTNVPNIQYCMRYQRNSGQTGTATLNLVQSMESVNSIPLASRAVTFSFYARAGANYSAASSALTVYLLSGTGTDQNRLSAGYTGDNFVINQTPILTTTWQRFTYSGTVPATATEIAPYFAFTPVGTAGANDYFEITGVQLEAANTASPYAPNGATYQAELAACQRYFFKSNAQDAMGTAQSATQAEYVLRLPVTMRTTPTISIPATYSFDAFGLGTKTGTSNTAGLLQSNALDFYTSGSSGLTVGTRTAYNDAVSVSAEL